MESNIKIITGVTLTPPTIGRIMMGHTELRGSGDGARAIPQKDDHFTITTLTQCANRIWEPHPIAAKLGRANEKLTTIPVTVAYNDPNLTLHNRYSCFDAKTGRTMCAGDGTTARRITTAGVQSIECARPEGCEYGQNSRCKSMTRAYFRIDGQDDELGVFVLRTTSFNTLERLAGRLSRLHGLTGGKLAGMPMSLTINSKTSAASYRTPFWFADLVQRPGMTLAQAVANAVEYQRAQEEAGLSQEGLEAAIRAGLGQSDFADELEDAEEWLSDEELAGAAERSLQRQGLRGLDSLAAAARQGEAASGQIEMQASSEPAASSAVSDGAAAAPPVVSCTNLPSVPAGHQRLPLSLPRAPTHRFPGART